jgi:hypothetical protein
MQDEENQIRGADIDMFAQLKKKKGKVYNNWLKQLQKQGVKIDV